jgi:TonB family protein
MFLRLPCHLILVTFIAALAHGAYAQAEDNGAAQLISVPKVDLPAAANDAGVGGKVSAKVTVAPDGSVTSVDQVFGPDWVCPAVNTPAVVALRSAVRDGAMKARFKPAMKKGMAVGSTLFITFTFVAPHKDDGAFTFGAMPVDPVPGIDEKQLKRSDGIVNGIARKLPKPEYPAAARAVGASGSVNTQILIDTDGSVYSAEAISGHPLLRAASRQAACNAQFSPTSIGGKPVRIIGIITYNFVP